MKAGGHPLWAELLLFRFDAPGVELPFSARLAKEERWNPVFGQRALEEYRRFLFLMCVSEHQVTPSAIIDKVWHLHLCDTRSYWEELCSKTLGRELHHIPTQGGVAEEEKFRQQYWQTLESYREWFGKEPPRDLWPLQAQQPKKRFHWTGEALLALGIAIQSVLWSLDPPQWWHIPGPFFLVVFLCGLIVTSMMAMWLPRYKLHPLLALFGTGNVQLWAGIQRGFPVGFLICLVFLNALILVWMFWGIVKHTISGVLAGTMGAGGGGGGGCGGGGCGGGGCGGG